MESKAVLFDFNGTMFFDEKFQDRAWREFLEEKIGRKITNDEFQKYVHGINAEVTFEYFFKRRFTRKEIVALEEEKEVIYRKLCLNNPNEFCLASGLEEFLDMLKENGIPVTIATASAFNNVKFFIEHLHLERWFSLDKIVYNDGSFQGKPEPDIYLLAAMKLGADITECAIFEDTIPGMTAGIRAGAGKVIGVASMLKEEQILAMEGVAGVIKDYRNRKKLFCMI